MSHFPMARCELCGAYAPCMSVSFHQHIGIIVAFHHSSVRGMLCKRCVDSTFLRTTLVTFLFGWWGIISFFVTLLFLPLNVITWLRSLSLPLPPPPEAAFADPFGPPVAAGPPTARASGTGADVLAILGLTFGAIALLITIAVGAVGVGMMVQPHTPKDPQAGLTCLLFSTVVCGLPGVLGAGVGAYRLMQRRRAQSPSR